MDLIEVMMELVVNPKFLGYLATNVFESSCFRPIIENIEEERNTGTH